MKTVKELREQSLVDLNKSLLETTKSLFRMRMKLATEQSKRTHELKQFKRQVARIKTVLTEKGRTEATAGNQS